MNNNDIYFFRRNNLPVAIRMKVNASETGRASQIPGVPAICGMRRNDGTRKTSPRAKEYMVAGIIRSML